MLLTELAHQCCKDALTQIFKLLFKINLLTKVLNYKKKKKKIHLKLSIYDKLSK